MPTNNQTPRQERFAENLARGMTQVDAYRDAYGQQRMSDKTLYEKASRLARSGKIRARVAEIRKPALDRIAADQARTLAECAAIAYFDPRECFNANGTLKALSDMPPHVAAGVSAVEVEELFDGTGKDRKWIGYRKRIKFWDKNSAIDKLMRHLGMFDVDNRLRSVGLLERHFSTLPRDVQKQLLQVLDQMAAERRGEP